MQFNRILSCDIDTSQLAIKQLRIIKALLWYVLFKTVITIIQISIVATLQLPRKNKPSIDRQTRPWL